MYSIHISGYLLYSQPEHLPWPTRTGLTYFMRKRRSQYYIYIYIFSLTFRVMFVCVCACLLGRKQFEMNFCHRCVMLCNWMRNFLLLPIVDKVCSRDRAKEIESFEILWRRRNKTKNQRKYIRIYLWVSWWWWARHYVGSIYYNSYQLLPSHFCSIPNIE